MSNTTGLAIPRKIAALVSTTVLMALLACFPLLWPVAVYFCVFWAANKRLIPVTAGILLGAAMWWALGRPLAAAMILPMLLPAVGYPLLLAKPTPPVRKLHWAFTLSLLSLLAGWFIFQRLADLSLTDWFLSRTDFSAIQGLLPTTFRRDLISGDLFGLGLPALSGDDPALVATRLREIMGLMVSSLLPFIIILVAAASTVVGFFGPLLRFNALAARAKQPRRFAVRNFSEWLLPPMLHIGLSIAILICMIANYFGWAPIALFYTCIMAILLATGIVMAYSKLTEWTRGRRGLRLGSFALVTLSLPLLFLPVALFGWCVDYTRQRKHRMQMNPQNKEEKP